MATDRCQGPACDRAADQWFGNGRLCATCGLDQMLQETDRFAGVNAAARTPTGQPDAAATKANLC